ncbi:MAG: hypothetical protein QGG64_21495 [Candidatus Latescibacteria bacterium]|nr:hypothetical protein [Candidatus Latescibacterota bacterium]
MASADKSIKIHLPLENLINTLCNLPTEDLKEVQRRIDQQLNGSDQSKDPLEALEDKEFWESELGREIIAEADDTITRKEVLKATASIKGSMAAAISAERDER